MHNYFAVESRLLVTNIKLKDDFKKETSHTMDRIIYIPAVDSSD